MNNIYILRTHYESKSNDNGLSDGLHGKAYKSSSAAFDAAKREFVDMYINEFGESRLKPDEDYYKQLCRCDEIEYNHGLIAWHGETVEFSVDIDEVELVG